MTRCRSLFVVCALVVGLGPALAGCSGDDDEPQSAPDTTLAGVTGTVPVGDLPVGVDTTVEPQLPPFETQDAPSAVRPQGEPGVARLAECVAAAACPQVDATLVAWPGAPLAGIDLGFATMTGADLRGADLSGANLSGANLSGADLSGANLDGADLSGADLSGATMITTSVQGADLSGATLFAAIIDGATFRGSTLCQTTWVDGQELNDMC